MVRATGEAARCVHPQQRTGGQQEEWLQFPGSRMFSLERLQQEPDAYVAELADAVGRQPDDVEALQMLAEAQFELGNAEEAMPLIQRSIELDPKGKRGASKFLWAGQLYGGRAGLKQYLKGVVALQDLMGTMKTDASRAVVGLQLSQAYLGMIEIWMTDLCMEPEAERECERLIAEAFLSCDHDPEAWSVLGSIRISQLRQEEAKTALRKAWELYGVAIEAETLEHSAVPKLVRLAQNMIELRLLEEVLEVTGELHRLDDQVPDLYYLNALCHRLLYNEALTDVARSKSIVAARDAVSFLDELEDEVDPELLEAARALANELPEPPVANPYEVEDRAMALDE